MQTHSYYIQILFSIFISHIIKWDGGRKLYGDAPIEMLHSDGTWDVPVDGLICQFISSPVLQQHYFLNTDI